MTNFWIRVHDDAPETATVPMFLREVTVLFSSFVLWCVRRPRGIVTTELKELIITRPAPIPGLPSTIVYSVVDTAKAAPPIQYIGDIADMIHADSRVLLLGLGGGALPYELRNRGVDVHLVAVDVDPDALAITRRVVPDGGNWTYVVSSARDFVAGVAPGSFDMVINDLYVGATMPPEALTRTFTGGVMKALRQGGVYVTNTMPEDHIHGYYTDLCWETELEGVLHKLCTDAGFIGVQGRICDDPDNRSPNTLVIAKKS